MGTPLVMWGWEPGVAWSGRAGHAARNPNLHLIDEIVMQHRDFCPIADAVAGKTAAASQQEHCMVT
jgi:hypothetical protein